MNADTTDEGKVHIPLIGNINRSTPTKKLIPPPRRAPGIRTNTFQPRRTLSSPKRGKQAPVERITTATKKKSTPPTEHKALQALHKETETPVRETPLNGSSTLANTFSDKKNTPPDSIVLKEATNPHRIDLSTTNKHDEISKVSNGIESPKGILRVHNTEDLGKSNKETKEAEMESASEEAEMESASEDAKVKLASEDAKVKLASEDAKVKLASEERPPTTTDGTNESKTAIGGRTLPKKKSDNDKKKIDTSRSVSDRSPKDSLLPHQEHQQSPNKSDVSERKDRSSEITQTKRQASVKTPPIGRAPIPPRRDRPLREEVKSSPQHSFSPQVTNRTRNKQRIPSNLQNGDVPLNNPMFDTKPRVYDHRIEGDIIYINGKKYRKVSYLVLKKRPTGRRQPVDYNSLSEAQKRVMEADLLNKFRAIQRKVSYLPIPIVKPGVDLNELVEVYIVYRRSPQMIENADFYKGIIQKIWAGFRTASSLLDLGKPVDKYFDSLIASIDRHDIMFREMAEVTFGEAGAVDPWQSFYKLTGYSILGGLAIIAANKFLGNALVNGYIKKSIDEFLTGITSFNSTGGPLLSAGQQVASSQPAQGRRDRPNPAGESSRAPEGRRPRPRPGT